MERKIFYLGSSNYKNNETVFVIRDWKNEETESIFIPRQRSLSGAYMHSVVTYYPKENRFEVDDIVKTSTDDNKYITEIYYANDEDKKILFEAIKKNGYEIQNGNLFKLGLPNFPNTMVEYGPTIDEFECCNVEKDLAGEFMPYYYVNSNYYPCVRKRNYSSPSEWMKMARKDIVHYNCFSNYADAEEAQRRVIRTLRQFQKEIMARKKH